MTTLAITALVIGGLFILFLISGALIALLASLGFVLRTIGSGLVIIFISIIIILFVLSKLNIIHHIS